MKPPIFWSLPWETEVLVVFHEVVVNIMGMGDLAGFWSGSHFLHLPGPGGYFSTLFTFLHFYFSHYIYFFIFFTFHYLCQSCRPASQAAQNDIPDPSISLKLQAARENKMRK